MYPNRDPNGGAKKLLWAAIIFLIIGTQLPALTITATVSGFGASVSESESFSYNEFQDEFLFGSYALDSNALIFWYIGIIVAIAAAIMLQSNHPQTKIVAFIGPILAVISLFQIMSAINTLDSDFGISGSYGGIGGDLSFDPAAGPIVGFIGVILGLIGAAKVKPAGTVVGTPPVQAPVYRQPVGYQQPVYQQPVYQQPAPQQVNYQQPPVNPNPAPVAQPSGDIFCPECGTKNEMGSTFCGNCGSKI